MLVADQTVVNWFAAAVSKEADTGEADDHHCPGRGLRYRCDANRAARATSQIEYASLIACNADAASEQLRQQLFWEPNQLADGEAPAAWAQRVMPLKNQLAPSDCLALEAGFAGHSASLATTPRNALA